MGELFNAITEIVASAVFIILAFIITAIVFAYSGYFVGMVVSLAAGFILGVSSALIPVIFAWAFIGIAAVLFVAIIAGK